MDTYHLLYRFRGDPPDKIGQITGTIPDIYLSLMSKIHKIDEFNLKDKDLQMVVRNRGDAIIMYDTVPTTFNPFIKEFRTFKGREEFHMAVRSKKTEKPAEQAQAQAQALTIEVLRAKDFTKDDAKENECSIVFDMKVNGVTIYGCWYRTGSDKKGEDYEMVSFPSQKGKDGKYYNHAYVQLQQSDIDFISSEIEKLL